MRGYFIWLVHVTFDHVRRVRARRDDPVANESDAVGLGRGRDPELLLTVAGGVVLCRERIRIQEERTLHRSQHDLVGAGTEDGHYLTVARRIRTHAVDFERRRHAQRVLPDQGALVEVRSGRSDQRDARVDAYDAPRVVDGRDAE